MKALKVIIGAVIGLIIIAGLFFVYALYINPTSPKGKASYKNGDKSIHVRYYRPFKKERLIFGGAAQGALVPYGTYWRLGANLTTKISTNQDLIIEGRTLPKGSYGLYTYPYADHWEVYVHNKTWGISYKEPAADGIVMKFKVAVQSTEEAVEQFTIDFVESSLRMCWDTTKVVIPIN